MLARGNRVSVVVITISAARSMSEMCTVYVYLLEEGTDVWRPVKAMRITDGMYRLLGPIPEGEIWEFQPDDIVRCEDQWHSGSATSCAVERMTLRD